MRFFYLQKSQIKRGKPRPKIMKYGVGGTLLVLLILLIWFPLLFFSFTSSFYQSNPPKEVYMDVKLDGYLVRLFHSFIYKYYLQSVN